MTVGAPALERRIRHDLRLVPAALVVWAAGLLGLQVVWWLALACGLSAALGSVMVLGTSRSTVAVPLLIAGLLVSGSLSVRLYSSSHDPLREGAESGAEALLRVVVTDRARPVRTEGFANQRGNGHAVMIRAEVREAAVQGSPLATTARVMVIAPAASWSAMLPGQEVTASGRLLPARPGEFLSAVLQVREPPLNATPAPWWQRAAEVVRRDLRTVSAVLGPEEAGLLPGLVAGDTSAMPSRVEEEFRDAGMSHLTAVSGSNVAIICGAVLLLLRTLRVGPRTSAALAGAALIAFVILVGYEPSVLRAGVMGAVGILALWLGRVRSAVPALAFAVATLVLFDPALAVSVGFALSVVATAALVLLAPGWAAALRSRGVPPGVAEGLAIPLAAFAATAPIIAGMAGEVSLVTVAANILAAPVVAPATVFGVLAALTAGTVPALAEVFVRLAGPEASWLIGVAREASAVPGAVITWPDGWWGGLLALVGVTAVLYAVRIRRLRVALAAALSGVLLVLLPMRIVAPGWPQPGWSFAACDVGQGDGFVLATAEPGRAVVVDTGNELGMIDRCLESLDVERIPLLVLSHLHADHIGGLTAALDGRSVGAVAVGSGRAPSWAWREVLDVAARYAVPVVELTVGERMRWPGLDVRVIGPRFVARSAVDETDGSAINNTSLVLMADTAVGRVLMTGDVELAAQADLLASGEDLDADVLKVPHHGSRYALPEFLDAVSPRIAVISVGAGNRYGHPNQGVIDMLTTAGATVVRTDTDGPVSLSADERGPWVVRARRGRLSPPGLGGPRRRSAQRSL